MLALNLTECETNAINALAQSYIIETNHLSYKDQLKKIAHFAYQLPKRLIEILFEVKYKEEIDSLLLKGLRIDDGNLGRTPDSWKTAPLRMSVPDVTLLLITSILGDAIGWSSQQNGRLVHNIVPIEGDEHKQIGSSTLDELWWHTEEAFHDCRCDYLGLLCLRNPQQVATLYASIEDVQLSSTDKKILFESHFSINPDDSHLDGKTGLINSNEEKVSVLFGDYNSPYLRLDPYYMKCTTGHKPIDDALNKIIMQINKNLVRVILTPGDLLIIDNFKIVHGREAYKAHYNGFDRWLKRVNITRDLRKSRKFRDNSESRIINYPANLDTADDEMMFHKFQ